MGIYTYILYIYIHVYHVYILRNAPIQNAWVYISFCAVRITSDDRALGHDSIDYFPSAVKKEGNQSIPNTLHLSFDAFVVLTHT